MDQDRNKDLKKVEKIAKQLKDEKLSKTVNDRLRNKTIKKDE